MRVKLVALLLCLLCVFTVPVYADEPASSASPDATATPAPDEDLTLGDDISGAYNEYADDLDTGLSDVKDQYDGVVSDNLLEFVGAITSWIPTEIKFIIFLSIAATVVLGIIHYIRS